MNNVCIIVKFEKETKYLCIPKTKILYNIFDDNTKLYWNIDNKNSTEVPLFIPIGCLMDLCKMHYLTLTAIIPENNEKKEWVLYQIYKQGLISLTERAKTYIQDIDSVSQKKYFENIYENNKFILSKIYNSIKNINFYFYYNNTTTMRLYDYENNKTMNDYIELFIKEKKINNPSKYLLNGLNIKSINIPIKWGLYELLSYDFFFHIVIY